MRARANRWQRSPLIRMLCSISARRAGLGRGLRHYRQTGAAWREHRHLFTGGGHRHALPSDPTDQAQLIEQIRTALAGVKSCTFDLEGDGIEVDISRQDLGTAARVLLEGSPVPFDAVNGWHMLSSTTVQLEGAACESWRVPGATSLDFDFPCDLIIIR